MTRTINEKQSGSELIELVEWLQSNPGPIIVERDGVMTAAIFGVSNLTVDRDLDFLAARIEALGRVRSLQRQPNGEEVPLTEAQAMAIANEAVNETVESLIDKGLIRYKATADN